MTTELTPAGAYVIAVLVVAGVLFMTEWLRSDLVALLVLVALGLPGILTPQEVLSGFSRSAVITILAIFVLTAGLERAGVTHNIGLALVRLGGFSEGRMVVVLSLSAAVLSLFMNTIAAGAVLLPVAMAIASERKISPSKLMMPLAFGALLGGMATLLTTTHILASAALRDAGYPALGFFSFIPLGVPATLVGVTYLYFFGRHLLPRRAPADWERMLRVGRVKLADVYELRERWVRASINSESDLAGKTLQDTDLGSVLGVNVLAIFHNGHVSLAPPPTAHLEVGDTLLLQARAEQLKLLHARGLKIEEPEVNLSGLTSEEIGLVEIVLSPRSSAVGKTLREIHFREKFGLNVIAIWHGGRPRRVGLGDMPLAQGDAMLMLGTRERIKLLQSEPDFIVLTPSADENVKSSRAIPAALIMIAALVATASGLVQIAEAMLTGALAMVLVGVLSMDDAYRAIEWRVIFLVAGILPAGLALTKTGAAAFIAEGLLALLGGFTPLIVLMGLILLTVGLTQVISGQAAIVVLVPIAIATAESIHSDPTTFTLGLAMASSIAFLTPLGHPVNILVMGPGGYKFKDYSRVGLPLTISLLIVAAIVLKLWYHV